MNQSVSDSSSRPGWKRWALIGGGVLLLLLLAAAWWWWQSRQAGTHDAQRARLQPPPVHLQPLPGLRRRLDQALRQ